ncbi:MAG: glycosyltransferase [Chloroflexi bacterium]|nr:glycosyltransferase [Chloroflexota bacterium]
MPVSGDLDPLVGALLANWHKILMTQASLQIDFRPQPRGIAVVTSVPISLIVENSGYSAFQDLVDGYASSFSKVLVVSPNGKSAIVAKRNGRVSWFSGPRWLSPMNGLWWTAIANRRELRNVDLVRTFGPRAGIVGRALSRFSNSPHVSSADDLASNAWRDKTGLRGIVPRFANRLGVLRADVLSATMDWELEYLAETGYMSDLLLGSRGLATDIYTPVGTTDPDRHPVVLWTGNMTGDDSVSLIAGVTSSTQKTIPNVEFIVVAEGDSADRLRSTSIEQDLPLTVASFEEVEPLVDLIERTWACVTVPGPRKKIPHGLAMLALSSGIPLISVGDLGENHGFQNHLNYIRVERAESEKVAYGLQLLRRWSSFALRIGSAGQRLVEERFSTRSVALVEGEQLARIATDLSVDLAMSDGARVLQEFAAQRSSEMESSEEENGGGAEPDSAPETPQESARKAKENLAAGFDIVAAAIAAANRETQPIGAANDEGADLPEVSIELNAGDNADETVEVELGARSFAGTGFEGDGVSAKPGDSSDRIETFGEGDIEPTPAPEMAIASEMGSPDEDEDEDDDNDGLPQINLVKIDISDISSGESVEETAVAGIVGPATVENDDSGVLDQDAISALFATNDEDDQAA